MDFSFTPEQDDLRREARCLPGGERVSFDGAARRARLGRDPGRRRLHVPRRCSALRGARARALRRAVRAERGRRPAGRRRVVDRDRRFRSPPQRGRPRAHAGHARRRRHRETPSQPSTRPSGSGGCQPNGAETAQGQWADVRRRLLAALALEAVGIGSKAIELALAYVSGREQFGKKIGSYQAISHSLVDGYVAVELSRSLAYWAAWCVAEDDEQVDLAVAAAKSQAAEAAVLACEKSIQAHGGIGFTWEHPLHRYYKRALWLESAFGYGREHRAEIATSLLSS